MDDLLCCHTGHPRAPMDAFLLAALLLPLPGWSSAFCRLIQSFCRHKKNCARMHSESPDVLFETEN